MSGDTLPSEKACGAVGKHWWIHVLPDGTERRRRAMHK
jgi:hypothetical protein